MTEISELDLQNLRHLIGGFDTTHCKMDAYAQQATDMEVKLCGINREGEKNGENYGNRKSRSREKYIFT